MIVKYIYSTGHRREKKTFSTKTHCCQKQFYKCKITVTLVKNFVHSCPNKCSRRDRPLSLDQSYKTFFASFTLLIDKLPSKSIICKQCKDRTTHSSTKSDSTPPTNARLRCKYLTVPKNTLAYNLKVKTADKTVQYRRALGPTL